MLLFSDLYSIGILFAPIFTCFAIILILSLDSWKATTLQWKIKSKVLMYFICSFLNWASLFSYFFIPTAFVYINWLSFLSFTLVQVFFYGFIFKITRINSNERFSKKHYILPLLLSLTLLIVSLITPYEHQLQVIKDQGICTNEAYRLFFSISNSKAPVRFIFSAVYIILAFIRLSRYRRHIVNYASNESKSRLKWVYTYLFLGITITPIPLIAICFNDRDFIISSYIMTAYYILFIIQYVYLCYYILKEQYIVVPDNEYINESDLEKENKELKKSLLNKDDFETYMQTQKPFLNPELKIIDLVSIFNINRTYISTFINTEFGMNFSSYINQCRLKEYYELRNNLQNSNLPNAELAEKAGFGSYKNFKRFDSQTANTNL
jgi:AraC-like DNA-binding protein